MDKDKQWQRKFELLQKLSEINPKSSNIKDVIDADNKAFKLYIESGGSLKDAYNIFNVFLKVFDNKVNQTRYRHIKKLVESHEKLK
jgi:DNA polymerase III gamma/tau subunit